MWGFSYQVKTPKCMFVVVSCVSKLMPSSLFGCINRHFQVTEPLKMLQGIRGIYMKRGNMTQDLENICSPGVTATYPKQNTLSPRLDISTTWRHLKGQVYLCAFSS